MHFCPNAYGSIESVNINHGKCSIQIYIHLLVRSWEHHAIKTELPWLLTVGQWTLQPSNWGTCTIWKWKYSIVTAKKHRSVFASETTRKKLDSMKHWSKPSQEVNIEGVHRRRLFDDFVSFVEKWPVILASFW